MVDFGASSSKQSSNPVDVTPEAFQALQGPFAQVLAQLLGFAPVAGTGGTAGGTTAAAPTAVAPISDARLAQGATLADPKRTPESIAREQSFVLSQAAKEGGIPFQVAGAGGTTAAATGPTAQQFAVSGDVTDVLRGIPGAPGPLTAGIAPGEQAVLDQLLARVGGEPTGISQEFLAKTIGGGFLPGAEGGGNPFLDSAIEAAQRVSLRGLEETLSRTLPGRFTQGGQFVQPQGSSAFDRAAAIATEGVSAQISDIASELSFAGFEAERGRQQAAAALLPQVSEQEVNTLVTNLQAQALPRLIEQLGLDAGTAAFNKQMNDLLQLLAITTGASQPVIGQESAGKSSSFNVGIF